MQQLNFIEAGKLEWREAPEPRLEADREAIVEPVAVATCDLDSLIMRGAVALEGPFPFGHEGVARVVEVGDAVKDVVPGDLVSIPFQVSCGSCEQCKRGRSAHCQAVPRLSMYGLGALSGGEFGGFLSDRVRVPFADHMLLALPHGVAPESVASLSDNIVDAWRTVGPQLEQEPGAEVLIVSAENSISLYAAAIARALGAGRVDFVGGGPREHKIAERLGANVIEGDFPERLGPYPITVNASDSLAGLACALRSTGPDGVCTSIGIYFAPTTPMPLFEMYTKGIHFLTGRVHARETMTPALALIEQGLLRPEIVTSQVVGWDNAAEALSDLHGKTVVRRDALNPAPGR
jgi:threonine dehydrogenase-like Zn-dependent dehydrogenase